MRKWKSSATGWMSSVLIALITSCGARQTESPATHRHLLSQPPPLHPFWCECASLSAYKGMAFERNPVWLSEDVCRFNKLTVEFQPSISRIRPQWSTRGSPRRTHRVYYVVSPSSRLSRINLTIGFKDFMVWRSSSLFSTSTTSHVTQST